MYKSIDDLPQQIKEELPHEARELYRAAYNRILEKESASEGLSPGNTHRLAHEGGMLAVRNEFEMDESGRWYRDPVGEHVDREGEES